MTSVSDRIVAFFAAFAQANTTFDQDLLVSLVSDPLVGVYPNGEVLALSKAEYLAGRPAAQEYLRALGFQNLTIVPLEEIPLGHDYVLVKTRGTMRLEQTTGHPVDLVHDSAYIVFLTEESPQIVFTITHEDLATMAHEHGIVPPT